jgi:hypothetical protein
MRKGKSFAEQVADLPIMDMEVVADDSVTLEQCYFLSEVNGTTLFLHSPSGGLYEYNADRKTLVRLRLPGQGAEAAERLVAEDEFDFTP